MPPDLPPTQFDPDSAELADPPFAAAMMALLGQGGPHLPGELAAALGVGEAEVTRELGMCVDVYEAADGWYSTWALAEGSVLLHIVSAHELELEVLRADGDLDLWGQLADEGVPLAGGGELVLRYRISGLELPLGASTGLAGPPGWLDGFVPEEVIGLRLVGGEIALEHCDQSSEQVEEQLQERLGVVLQAALRMATYALDDEEFCDLGASLDEIVLEALLTEPTLFQEPLVPLSVLAVMAGLEVCHGYAALPGGPGSILDSAAGLAVEQRIALAGVRSRLVMVANLDPVALASPEATDELSARFAPVLQILHRDPEVLAAFAVTLVDEPLYWAALPPLVAAAAPGGERAAAFYLWAVASDGDGNVVDAQAQLDEALGEDGSFTPALQMAGDYAAERGDAFGADRLYRRAGLGVGTPVRNLLREFLKVPEGVGGAGAGSGEAVGAVGALGAVGAGGAGGAVGRNHPCPCGSGRKFKLCCGKLAVHPLPRRALWRYRRALFFALHPVRRDLLADLAVTIAGPAAAEIDLADPMVADLAFVEGGIFAEYLEMRRDLMPPDEAALIEAWMETRLAVWEVISTRPGRDLTVRALPAGPPVVLTDRAMSGQLGPLDLFVARLYFDGVAEVLLTAPMWIPRGRRPQLVALLAEPRVDPFAVAEALAPSQTPTMATREGEDIVMCNARYALSAPAETWKVLAAPLEQDGDDLLELATIDGEERIMRGRLRLADEELVIETNSMERLRRLQQRVLDAAPDARLISESTVPLERLMAERAAAGGPVGGADGGPGGGPGGRPGGRPGGGRSGGPMVSRDGDIPPEIQQQVLGQYIEQREAAWLDESIPALGGLTPRAAAADPVARAELEALLDDVAWQEAQSTGMATMKSARIRASLGLPAR